VTKGLSLKNEPSQISSPQRVEHYYEVEATTVVEVFSHIPKEEQETIGIMDEAGTNIYSCVGKMVRKLLREVADGHRKDWKIQRIVHFDGKPIEVSMQHEKSKLTIKK
jgi:hypothetical protein